MTKLPPTAALVMSVKAPAMIFGEETSKTPPSNVLSRLKLLRKITCAVVDVILIFGVSSVLLETQLGSLWNASLGAVSGVVADVVQLVPSVQSGPPTVQSPSPFVNAVTHPAGKAGAVTPSKFSIKAMASTPSVNV